MQCLTHVLRLALMVGVLVTSTSTLGAQETVVDQLYCDSADLMAKAGAEAKQRGESLPKWRQNLLAMKGYGVRNKDNVLYRVLPRVIEEAPQVYQWHKTPMDTYVTSFNTCMQNDFGHTVAVN